MSETQTLEQFVKDQLRSGIFSSYDEMVAEGLRLLQDKIQTDSALAEELQPAIVRADEGYAGANVSLAAVKRLSEKYLAEANSST